MARIDPLAAEALHRSCDPALLPFDTTAELDDLEEIPGQERAVEAIHFSTEVELAGYNLFVLGPSGSGRHHAVREFLKQHARNRPVPPDICYVNNFEDPRKPVALSPPAGLGAALNGRKPRSTTFKSGPGTRTSASSRPRPGSRSRH